MLGSKRSMKAAHCSPKISAEVCECTCQTALPGTEPARVALGTGELEAAGLVLLDVLVEVGPYLVPLFPEKLVRQQQFHLGPGPLIRQFFWLHP